MEAKSRKFGGIVQIWLDRNFRVHETRWHMLTLDRVMTWLHNNRKDKK